MSSYLWEAVQMIAEGLAVFVVFYALVRIGSYAYFISKRQAGTGRDDTGD